jgi:hypothetical protein
MTHTSLKKGFCFVLEKKNIFRNALTQEILRNCLSAGPASQFPSLKLLNKNNYYNNKIFRKMQTTYKHPIVIFETFKTRLVAVV